MNEKTIKDMPLDGGVACLDFINSGYDNEANVIVERIHDYNDLLILAERVKLLDRSTIGKLRQRAGENKRLAIHILEQARVSRSILYVIFDALATRHLKKLEASDLSDFNTLLHSVTSYNTYQITGKEISQKWTDVDDLALPLAGFVNSAAELLRSGQQSYIKKCAACAWLFLDTSKSHKRKWCDMQTCGSSAKSKRYYQKKKKLSH